MKKVFFLIGFLFIGSSCSHRLVLSNRVFVDRDSIKINSLDFINDSICIYKQSFKCEIQKPYKEIRIICKYETFKNKVILENLTSNTDSIGITCFIIPERELLKCSLINEILSEKDTIIIGAPKTFTMHDLYGYINNVNRDTLFYKRNVISYNKLNRCHPYTFFMNFNFREE